MSLPLDLRPSPEAERLIRLIGSARVDLSTEAAAQRGLARLFEADGLGHQAEVPLSAADRIDFLVGRVGVEVKIGQPRRQILRQLERYAGSDRLTGFSAWFLTVMRDQIAFTAAMFDLKGLEARYADLLDRLHPGRDRLPRLISHALRHGEMARGDAPFVAGVRDRAARNDLALLLEAGFLRSDTPKGPVRVGFPLDYRESLFPNLFSTREPVVADPPEIPVIGF